MILSGHWVRFKAVLGAPGQVATTLMLWVSDVSSRNLTSVKNVIFTGDILDDILLTSSFKIF